MRVLVIGSGAREHALCWAIAASPLLETLWCAPGNPGIAAVADCVPIGEMDFTELVAFARAQRIDLVVPGPEAPLVEGIVDHFRMEGLTIVGPTRTAAANRHRAAPECPGVAVAPSGSARPPSRARGR